MSVIATTATVDVPSVAGMDDADLDTLRGLLRQWRDLLPRNQMRAARYDGKNAVRDLGISTPPHLRNLPIVLGWPAKAVDMLNQHVHLDGWSLPGADADSMPFVQSLADNRFELLATQVQQSALTHGVAFFVVTLGDEAAGEPRALVTACDALTSTGRWNPRTRKLDAFLSLHEFDDMAQPTALALYLPNRILSCRKIDGTWTMQERAHAYGVPVEPLVHFPDLRRPLGRSRITRALVSLHDSALRTVLRSEISAEFYSMPKTVLLGADESAFAQGAWQAVVSRIMALPDDDEADNPRAEVHQLATAPQTPHMEQLRAWGQLFAHEASLPVSSLGVIGEANPTSAEAIDAARMELVTLADATTTGWSPSLQRVAHLVQQMTTGRESSPELATLRPVWRNARYTSQSQAADAGSKQLAAVPWLAETEVGLQLLGLTEEQIDRALSQRRRAEARMTAELIAQAAADASAG